MNIYEHIYHTYKQTAFKAKQLYYIKRYGKCDKPQFDVLTGDWLLGGNVKGCYVIKNGSIDEIMSLYTGSEMVYHFKELSYSHDVIGAYSFNDVMYMAYTYPDTFRIPKQYLSDYSHQELDFLKKLIIKCREEK